jgi:hypothetical protein
MAPHLLGLRVRVGCGRAGLLAFHHGRGQKEEVLVPPEAAGQQVRDHLALQRSQVLCVASSIMEAPRRCNRRSRRRTPPRESDRTSGSQSKDNAGHTMIKERAWHVRSKAG